MSKMYEKLHVIFSVHVYINMSLCILMYMHTLPSIFINFSLYLFLLFLSLISLSLFPNSIHTISIHVYKPFIQALGFGQLPSGNMYTSN